MMKPKKKKRAQVKQEEFDEEDEDEEDESGDYEEDESGDEVEEEIPKTKLPKMPTPPQEQPKKLTAGELLTIAEDYMSRATELIKYARGLR